MRQSHAYNIALFDIDHFKAYNDTQGHQAGDALLAELGKTITAEVRQGDLAYRYGGEEFLVVLANPKIGDAARATERLRRCVAQATGSHLPASVTLSAGVAAASSNEPVESVIGRADRALYRAKNAGRDQVAVDADPLVLPA